MSKMKLTCLLLALTSVLPAGHAAHAKEKSTPEVKDAKKDTMITTHVLINSVGKYEVWSRCVEGDHHPITSGVACFIANEQTMELKIVSNGLTGLPQKAMIYQVTAHNGSHNYICDDSGPVERGYAATVREIVQGAATKTQNVCTTVSAVGHNTTEAKLTVTEKTDGFLYVRFENLGRHWDPTGGYPDSTGDIKVDFSQIPN
ncbi:MAG: hypothetical protein HC897_02625 [Thermoanaerobaculia bacterium]|nr:hypothetical protein [Thermoanaerobaculia bacterium]